MLCSYFERNFREFVVGHCLTLLPSMPLSGRGLKGIENTGNCCRRET